MIPELGHFALIIALLLALTQGILPLIGAHRGNATLMGVARPAAQGQFVFVAFAFGCLAWSFLNNDFSVENVAHNSFSQLPEIYRFPATWGSHEGSLLLWTLILTIWTVAVSIFSRHLPDVNARVKGQTVIVNDTIDTKGVYIVTTNSGLREKLSNRYDELVAAEAALSFDPANNDTDFQALVNGLGYESPEAAGCGELNP